MKLLILLTVVACLQASAKGFGQTVSLSLTNAPLEQAFKEIKKQTGYSFVFTRAQLKNARPINCQVKDAELKDVLELCFRNQPLSFVVEDRYIVVQTKTTINESTLSRNSLMDIVGKVINENGEALAGVTITAKKTSKATSTNERGEFFLKEINDDDILIITSVGYAKEEIPINKQSNFLIRLRIAVGTLDEAIIMAYGKTTRRLNTGNISKITAEEISRQPVSNPLSTMQGRVAGAFVNTQNGLPGGNITIQIRGRGSINAGTDPLYVINGVPFISTPLNETFSTLSDGINGKTSPLNNINPADIESIEVLKDADATAIYGSRAANGVILITTKKGISGKTKINVNLQSGISRLADFPQFLNTRQYLQLRQEGFQNSGVVPTVSNAPDLLVWDTTKSVNWPKNLLGGTAHTTSILAGVSGGNEYTSFLISGNYRTEGTILRGDQQYRRAGAHLTLQHSSANRKFSLDFSSTYTSDINKQLPTSLLSLLRLPPNIPMYDNAGNYNWVGIRDNNPEAVLRQKQSSQSNNLLTNLTLRYWILPNLQYRTSFGYTTIEMDQVMTYPSISLNPNFGLSSYAYYGNNRNKTYIIEPALEYSKKSKFSDLKLLMGASWQKSIRTGNFISGENYSNDDLLEYVGAAGTTYITNLDIQYKYASVFGRFHYAYKEKYILNASLRRDGSSRFGPGNQFGTFGAMGVAWLFANESFLKKSSFFTYGKLRASYGITGNDLISDYQYLSSYRNGETYQGTTGLTPARIANADFAWENNKKLEAALEIGLWKNKVLITTAWYLNRSGNQLLEYPLPFTSGPFGSYQANLPALVENKGWEFELTATAIKRKNISLSVFGNISISKNKLVKYPGLASSSFANTYVIGKDLSIYKALKFTGINSQTGLPEYEDINHDGIISTPSDWAVVGRTSPFFYGGFGSDLKIKQFTLNLFFQFSKQYAPGLSTIPGPQSNNFIVALKRWQKPGDATAVPKAGVLLSSPYFNLSQSDAIFYNASYLRLKNISISYQLSEAIIKKINLNSCKLYIDGQNMITWHKEANLYDPETGNTGVGPLKTIVFGIQLTF